MTIDDIKEQLKTGDKEQQLKALYKLHPFIRKCVHFLKHKHYYEDVVSETVMKMYDYLPGLAKCDYKHLLQRCRYAAWRISRRYQRRYEPNFLEPLREETEIVELDIRLLDLKKLVYEQLPPFQREVLMHYFGVYKEAHNSIDTFSKIAEKYNTTYQRVSRHINKGLTKLRKAYEDGNKSR